MATNSTSSHQPTSHALTARPLSSHPGDASARRWWILAVLSLSLVIIGLDNTVLNVALPSLQREFDATSSQLQWMVDSYVVVFAGLLLILGALGDRFGRAKALQAGLLIFGASSLWAAYATSADMLIAARAGIGIGLGPIVAGLLLEWFWWGSVFLINVPIAVLALGAGWWLVPDSRDPTHPPLDLPGAALSISAVSLLVYSIIEAPVHGWTDPLTLALFAGALVLIAAFAWWEIRTPHPMLDFAFFRNRRFSLGSAAIGITFFALFGTIFTFTQYLQFVQGYTALEAGARLTPLALGIAIGAGRSDHLVRRFGTTMGGMILVATVLASFALLDSDTSYWIVGVTVFFLALGMGNVMAPSTDSVMGAIPEAKAGVGSAMNDVVRQVAGALGVAIIGSIMNTVYRDRMADETAGLPGPAADAARDSVGAALHVANEVGGPAGAALANVARSSFIGAMGIAALVAAAFAVAGAAIIGRWLPSRHADAPPVEEPALGLAGIDRQASAG